MCSLIFLRSVLEGKKSLLKLSETPQIPGVPKIAEIDIRKMWGEIKGQQKMAKYFPDIYQKDTYVPDRKYFFTVK